MSILSTLSIAAQAMKAQQLAMQTIGHNIANSTTPGFSRQRVDVVSAHPSFEGGVFVGQGVDVEAVVRIVDRFVEAELFSLSGDAGYSEAESKALDSIQEIFPLSGGVSGALSEFFGALSDLANNPAGLAERISVIAKARGLGESLAHTRQLLTSAQQNLDRDMQSTVERINIVLAEIAGLNKQIAFTEVGGEFANDFRDRRQTLLQEITNLTGATVRDDTNGQVTVTVGGLLLVGTDRHASFHADDVNLAGLHALTYVSPDGTSFDASALITGGQIGALLNTRDNAMQDMIDRVDLFAKNLVDEVNAQHALGFDLIGNAGGNLFDPVAVVAGAAATVRVDAALGADPRLIAAAASADALPGDNRNALALVDLRSTTLGALGGQTLEDYFLALVGDVGVQVEGAQARLDFRQELLTRAKTRRESVSGVNIDEEMTKLIQFQRAFEASSLLVRSADEMYRALIEMVG